MITTFAALAIAAAAPVHPVAADFSHAPVVAVSLSDFKFTPNTIRLKARQPVILRVRNVAEQAHDFAAPTFFKGATVRPADAAIVRKGEVETEAGKSVEIGLIPAAGRYPLQCNKPGHASLGMKGTIIVE